MYKVWWKNGKGVWTALVTEYRTESAAWRAVHELIEEVFGVAGDPEVPAEAHEAARKEAENYEVRPA